MKEVGYEYNARPDGSSGNFNQGGSMALRLLITAIKCITQIIVAIIEKL